MAAMARQRAHIRSVISLGLPPDVRQMVEDFHRTVGVNQSVPDSIRELIMRGAGVEADVAALAAQRRQIRRIGEKFLMERIRTVLQNLDVELKTYIDTMFINGDIGGEG